MYSSDKQTRAHFYAKNRSKIFWISKKQNYSKNQDNPHKCHFKQICIDHGNWNCIGMKIKLPQCSALNLLSKWQMRKNIYVSRYNFFLSFELLPLNPNFHYKKITGPWSKFSPLHRKMVVGPLKPGFQSFEA